MFALGSYALTNPHELKLVAVAEPNKERRSKFSELYDIPPDMQFESWEDLLDQPKFCDAVLICTMDRDHFGPTMKAGGWVSHSSGEAFITESFGNRQNGARSRETWTDPFGLSRDALFPLLQCRQASA